MADRMAVSWCKYGLVADAYPTRADAIASLHKRLEKYAETGNTEWLMDVANFAMIEFMRPRHSQAHFRGTDSHESPGRVFEGLVSQRRNDAEVQRLYKRDGD
jgi:adenylate kinase family enzyme